MTAAYANIVGLVVTLIGVVGLFLFGMPFHIRLDGGEVITTNPTEEGRRREKIANILSWISLALIVAGTAFQIYANLL